MPLILYTRHGCHLCEDFEQELLRLQQDHPQAYAFSVEIRMMSTRARSGRAAFNDLVPLLLAGSEEISRYFLDLERHRRYLGSA